jgi:hypothetical protein
MPHGHCCAEARLAVPTVKRQSSSHDTHSPSRRPKSLTIVATNAHAASATIRPAGTTIRDAGRSGSQVLRCDRPVACTIVHLGLGRRSEDKVPPTFYACSASRRPSSSRRCCIRRLFGPTARFHAAHEERVVPHANCQSLAGEKSSTAKPLFADPKHTRPI